jgi:hypothetical protein
MSQFSFDSGKPHQELGWQLPKDGTSLLPCVSLFGFWMFSYTSYVARGAWGASGAAFRVEFRVARASGFEAWGFSGGWQGL